MIDVSLVKLRDTLKNAGSSATRKRVVLFEHLQKQSPISVGRLSKAVSPGIDRATVYRNIALFEKLGIVNRIWHGFKHQIELSEIFTPHHHHALCQSCGKTVDIASKDLESVLAELGKRHQFLTISHTVELLGYCVACQKN